VTSATPSRPTAAICCTSNRVGFATAVRRSSSVLGAVRTSTPASTRSVLRPRSRPPPPISTGWTKAFSSASAAGRPEVW